MPKIPDRWIPYKACGDTIEGTRFICFKVPLKKSVQVRQQSIKEIWDIPALLERIPNLVAVIDLTNTARYYDPRELQAAGVFHRKILIPGRIIPPENKVREFLDAVDEFLEKDRNSVLGVHCTHGLNRTGYMVVRYMRDRLGIPAMDAIRKFEKARGYQIERENYIANLLGKKDPPPDFGKHTNLMPVNRRSNMDYQSPLGCDYEDNEDTRDHNNSRYRYDKRVPDKNREPCSRKYSDNYHSGSSRYDRRNND